MGGWLMGQDTTAGKAKQAATWASLPQEQAAEKKAAAGGVLTDDEKRVVALAHMGQPTGSFNLGAASPMSPDATDAAVQARKMSQGLQLLSGRGRASSMLNGSYDETGSMLGGL